MGELEPTGTEHEPTATERLRALLDERGVGWDYGITGPTTTRLRVNGVNGIDLTFTPMRHGLLCSTILTPEQAIAATLGSCNCSNNCTNGGQTSDSDVTGERQGDAGKVYLVEASDELIEGWCPLVAYLSREAAEGHAESLRGEVDGVMGFARVVEMEVLG